jgi:hypothetical protein
MALADDWRMCCSLLQGSRFRGRSGWLQKLYSLLGRGEEEDASAIVAVVKATKPAGHRSTKRAGSMRRQQTALIVHEEPAL